MSKTKSNASWVIIRHDDWMTGPSLCAVHYDPLITKVFVYDFPLTLVNFAVNVLCQSISVNTQNSEADFLHLFTELFREDFPSCHISTCQIRSVFSQMIGGSSSVL